MLDVDIEVPRRHFVVSASFRVAAGERFALFGPSGGGKTTILHAVAGLVEPRRGHIHLGKKVLWSGGAHGRRPGEVVPIWERAVALLQQEPSLFPHLNVRENIAYSRRRLPSLALDEVVALLDLAGLLEARPSDLSGGQAHRVALARALASDCRVLLLDEPYTGLDAGLRRQAAALVLSELERREIPSVLVSHDLTEAQAFADRMGIIDAGRVLQIGPPHDVVLRPASRRVAELVGYRGFVEVDGAIVGVHPERVLPGAHRGAGPVLTGRVLRSRPSGPAFDADLEVGGTELTVRLADDAAPRGATMQITAIDPPRFTPQGDILASTGRRVHESDHPRPLDS